MRSRETSGPPSLVLGCLARSGACNNFMKGVVSARIVCHATGLDGRIDSGQAKKVQFCACMIGTNQSIAVQMTGKTLCANDLAQYIGVSRRTFYNMLKDGRFSVPHIPGTWPRRWAIEHVDSWRLSNGGVGQ